MKPVVQKTINDTIRVAYGGKRLGDTRGSLSPMSPNFAEFISYFPGKKVYDIPASGQDEIAFVDNKTPEEVFATGVDALITKSDSNLLTLRAADCIPLVFFAPGHKILGLAHVGTSGAALGLPRKMVQAIGLEAQALHCYVGPSISQKAYRFEEEKFEKKLDSSWDSYISREPDGIHINLIGYVLDELSNCGLKPSNITIERVDTGSDPAYFSHRRYKLTGEPNGRNALGACLI
jgi:copper oxidase (laccase) domain-containing protein